jgi:hypothetical protein
VQHDELERPALELPIDAFTVVAAPGWTHTIMVSPYTLSRKIYGDE